MLLRLCTLHMKDWHSKLSEMWSEFIQPLILHKVVNVVTANCQTYRNDFQEPSLCIVSEDMHAFSHTAPNS